MQTISRSILVLHPDATLHDRIRAAAEPGVPIRVVGTWPALTEALQGASAATTVIVDPYAEAPEGEPPRLAEELNTLTVSFPSVPVLAAVTPTLETVDHLRTLARWGVTELIWMGHDDTPGSLGIRLRHAQAAPLKAALEAILPLDLPGRASTMLSVVADVVAAGGQGQDLARHLRMSRRTLLRWAERAQLPPPRRTMAWLRILLAGLLLDDPGRTVRGAAVACGYGSDSGLRRVTGKFLGLTPTQMRNRGAFAAASKGFLRALAEHRAQAKTGGAAAPLHVS